MTVPTTAAMTAAANIVKVSLADMPFAQLLAERFPVVRQDNEEPTDEDMEEEDLGECECLPCPTPEELAEMCEEDDDECCRRGVVVGREQQHQWRSAVL